ncbi:MAG: ATP-binding cassette domain-containing protein [Culicoidibacterales bacterium]
MLEIKNVSKKIGETMILTDISLTISSGLNFIVGPSGSGKTTLLKIMSGMDSDFDGVVTYRGQQLKQLTAQEQSFFYHKVFGFIWQDNHLLQEYTVLENLLLPMWRSGMPDREQALKIIEELQLQALTNKKVKKLSGGQKQRVAIARELMKNPEVIIADEPTSALDEATKAVVMEIFQTIAKKRTVIIVTHDQSCITPQANVYTLAEGKIEQRTYTRFQRSKALAIPPKRPFPFKRALQVATLQLKHHWVRIGIHAMAICFAAVLLGVMVSGSLTDNAQQQWQQLYQTYGEQLLDISLYNHMIDSNASDETATQKPNGEISQELTGVYEQYRDDERIAFMAYVAAFDGIQITLDGRTYAVESSASMPAINRIIAGEMPNGSGNEVVIPESLLANLGETTTSIIGKELVFNASINKWQNNEPIATPTQTTVKVVGVIDTTVVYEYEGQQAKFSVDDAFFFSHSALSELVKPIGGSVDSMNLLMRTKTPEALLEMKAELNKQGLVPTGSFALVEDVVQLQTNTTQLSTVASNILGGMALLVVGALALIQAFLRQSEFAIYKMSGYGSSQLASIIFAEHVLMASIAMGLFAGAAVFFQRFGSLSQVLVMSGLIVLLACGQAAITIALSRSVTIERCLRKGSK